MRQGASCTAFLASSIRLRLTHWVIERNSGIIGTDFLPAAEIWPEKTDDTGLPVHVARSTVHLSKETLLCDSRAVQLGQLTCDRQECLPRTNIPLFLICGAK